MKAKKYNQEEEIPNFLSEPIGEYITAHPPKNNFLVKDFTYKNFKKILDKSPFTLAEWALLLHISERTLQRYAKDNTDFNGLLIDRILELEALINFGNEEFGIHFKAWLQSKPYSLMGKKPMELLLHGTGIKQVYNLIGQIVHGNLA